MDEHYSSDEDLCDPEYQITREGVIFCIDSTQAMLKCADGYDKCFLQRSFQCVRSRMLHNIMVSDKEFMGIVLMGASAVNGANNDDATVTLFEVSRPGAEIVKKINGYINSNNFQNDFEKEFVLKADYSLADALWSCQSMLARALANTKFGPKEVLLLTCQDQEHLDVISRRQACTRAEALMQVGISLRLFYLGEQFRIQHFYRELLMVAHPSNDTEISNSHWAAISIDEKPDAGLSRSSYNRHIAKVDWTISPGLDITILFYSLYRKQGVYEPRKVVKLDQRSNDQVKGAVSRFDKESGSIMANSQLYKGVQIADRSAIFSQEESYNMRNLYNPGLVLLGFKPLSEIAWEDFIRPGRMMLPDNSSRPGSSSLFYALLEQCLVRKVAPVCRLLTRTATCPRIVHLLPQRQGEDEVSGGALGVACFHALTQPFSGEIRLYESSLEEISSTENQIKLAEKIVKKLCIKYKTSNFKNPEVLTYHCAVEALALDYEETEDVVDPLDPDVESMNTRIGPLSQEFLSSIASSEEISMSLEQSSKSNLSSSSTGLKSS